jgi:hypothetical protein
MVRADWKGRRGGGMGDGCRRRGNGVEGEIME